MFGTFNRLRLYLLGNREVTFTSSKKIKLCAGDYFKARLSGGGINLEIFGGGVKSKDF